jgi:hypothetical protein
MKKKIEVGQDDITVEQVENAIKEKAVTTKEYQFKRTYVGLLGAFYRGEKYFLTQEQYDKLKGEVY